MRLIMGIATCVLMFLPVASQADGLFSLNSTLYGREWDAVGRLEIAGEAFCTGALIAPDLVLTAAHCVFDPETGERVATDEIQFLAGWRNGRAAAYRRVRRAEPHPEYDFRAASDAGRVRVDIALLELQHPIRNGTIKPFETGSRPDTGAEVGVVSYAHDRADAPSLQDLCDVISRQQGVLVMSCTVDFGSSGSPVFSFDGDAPQIVSVVSAKAEADGEAVSLGTSLAGPLSELRALIEMDTRQLTGTSLQRPGVRNDATGAKFVRP